MNNLPCYPYLSVKKNPNTSKSKNKNPANNKHNIIAYYKTNRAAQTYFIIKNFIGLHP